MTKHISYTAALLAVVFTLTACSQDEVDFYDKNSNGIYFNYDDEKDLSTTVNFADYVQTDPTEVEQTLKLQLLGYVADTDRHFVLKTREVDGYPLANISISANTLPAGAHELDVTYSVGKPEEMGVTYAVEIYLDPTDGDSELGEGVEGFDKYTVYVTEQYNEPTDWVYPAGEYLGSFTAEKYKFMVKITGMTDFYTNAKWDWSGTYVTNAVDSIRKYNKENPDNKLMLGIPFSSDISYSKPDYWTEEHDYYLGSYSSRVFAAIANAVGATTDDEEELLSGSEDRMKDLNKAAITYMMERFNSYYYWQMSPSQFKWSYSTLPMFSDIDYDVVQPECWQTYNDTYDYVAKYYGEYSDEKYKFMLKTWLAYTDNTDDYAFVQLFPVYYGWDSTWTNQTALYDEEMGGEDAIKECYRVIKAEYDKNPDAYNFSFPDVE